MPIDVLWETMDWAAATSGPAPTVPLRVIRDDRALLERLLANLPSEPLPFLRFISHETVTVFHQQNIPQLHEELDVLAGLLHVPDAAKHLEAVRGLVADARGVKDSLIAFRVRSVGDAD